MIEVQHLTKRYGRVTAVDDLNFRVERGEILGFLGPNGAGKTTTMRILTGYMPATGGKAVVAGFDVFDQPIEAKRRTGYLPETPPLYPEMTVREYLQFVARIKTKGMSASERKNRVEESMKRTRVDDMATRHCGKLSKGYRQRVGLAQAILHNPEVLILDEPTAGLDPKQIIETRQLIKELAGTHTIVLSTHILPEVSQTCDRVVIINKGRVVAIDTPANLTARLRGSETLYVEVDAAGQDPTPALRSVPGVLGVTVANAHDGILAYDVSSERGRDVRRDLARTVVSNNWGLLELRPSRMSLEEIFLSLTTEEKIEEENRRRRPMSNALAIAQKELKSYFASPIAYIIIGVFALVFGYFYFVSITFFLQASLQMGMPGAGQININTMAIRPLLQNIAVVALFMLPLITMRTYAEEKRTGTIELLLTSPLTDMQIVMGKFLGAVALYLLMLAVTWIHIGILFIYGNPEWKPILTGYLGLLLMGASFMSIGLLISSLTRNQIVAGVVTFATLLLLWTLNWMSESSGPTTQKVLSALSITERFDDFSKGVISVSHLVYYVSFITFGLFLTAKSVDSERWRG